jgi:hypothetical protein
VVFTEDLAGWTGESSMVVSFLLPSWLLTNEPNEVSIGLNVRTTPASVMTLMETLGMELNIFSAKLMDETLVHIVPDASLVSSPKAKESALLVQPTSRTIGTTNPVIATLDQECRSVVTLSVRVDVAEAKAKSELSGEAAVKTEQVSPCAMKLILGDSRQQEVAFPFPITGSASKLRVARKSSYIEVS